VPTSNLTIQTRTLHELVHEQDNATRGVSGMMLGNRSLSSKSMLMAGLVAISLFVSTAQSQSAQSKQKVAGGQASPASTPSRYRPDRFAGRAGTYYRLVWGVEHLGVKSAESGEVIRFNYTVLDADKAKALNDKKAEPFLIDPQAKVKLVVPSLEKVGQLRQSGTPEAGKSYWMAFSNKGGLVKRGDRVSVVIGRFRADGLVVD
jgi:hypothetical protein